MSASDMNDECFKFVYNNLTQGAPTHWFPTMHDQVHSTNCKNHPGSVCCNSIPETPDLYVAGTPCHPFSTQRSDRFQAGSVSNHHEFHVSMTDFADAMAKSEPVIAVAEQVLGFELPLEKGSTTTPKSMFLDLFDTLIVLHLEHTVTMNFT